MPSSSLAEYLSSKIRDVPDFPQPGVMFKDITPLLQDPEAFRRAVDGMAALFKDKPRPDLVIGVESRGFIFAAPIAYNLAAGFVPVRKLGKLPADTINIEYALEYGTNTLEMHNDAIKPGQRVLIVDDVLATGGTVAGTSKLIEKLGGEIVGLAFLVELTFLHGRDRLNNYDVRSVIQY